MKNQASLILAVSQCDVGVVNKLLVSCRDVSMVDRAAPSGLIQQALKSKGVARMHVVSLLARRGARVNITNDFGISPLFEVLTSSLDNVPDRIRALSALLAGGADPNECIAESSAEVSSLEMDESHIETSNGKTSALGVAIQVGDIAALELLLDAGANPDAPSSLLSPLRVAAKYRQHACLATLLVRGANANHRDGERMTAVASARDLETLTLLEAAGAHIDGYFGSNSERLLHIWCWQATDDTLLRLLARRFPEQIWERDAQGNNAISKLWRRWSTRKDEWIPKLISDWETQFLEHGTAVAMGRGRPTRL